MIQSRLASTVLAFAAIGGFVLVPSLSLADDHGKGKKNDHHDNRGRGNDHRNDQKKWKGNNGKSPKDRGLHDNRNQWWKDDHRSSSDWRRRQEEQRRAEEWRRAAERRRLEENRRYNNNYNYRDSNLQREYDRRQQTKNEWRNIAYVGGAVAILGLLKHDNTLTFAGTAGALYSLYRYEQDRKSQNSLNHLRAEYFSRPYFVRDGRRYDRHVVTKNGQRYYQFRKH